MRLQSMSLGEYITTLVCNAPKELFIKTQPSKADDILEMNQEMLMLDPEEYQRRFEMPLPGKMKITMRYKLVELGYVTEEQVIYKD